MSSFLRVLALMVIVTSMITAAIAGNREGNIFKVQQAQPAEQPAVWNPLTGTYREKESRDETLVRKILIATARLENQERDKQARALVRIMRSAPLFAIEQYGTTIIFNYPYGTRVSYEADGKTRVFRATGNESVSVRGEIAGYRLTIDLTWSGGERLRLIFERPPSDEKLTFTRIATNNAVPVPVSEVSEYERVLPKGTRKFAPSRNR